MNKRLLVQFSPLLVYLWVAPVRSGSATPHSWLLSANSLPHSFCMRSNNIGYTISHTTASLVVFIVFSFPPALLPSLAIRSLIWTEFLGSQETVQLSPIQENRQSLHLGQMERGESRAAAPTKSYTGTGKIGNCTPNCALSACLLQTANLKCPALHSLLLMLSIWLVLH